MCIIFLKSVSRVAEIPVFRKTENKNGHNMVLFITIFMWASYIFYSF